MKFADGAESTLQSRISNSKTMDNIQFITKALESTHRVLYKGNVLPIKLGETMGSLKECIRYIQKEESKLDRYFQHSMFTIEKLNQG